MRDDGWGPIFETEREILRRQLRHWQRARAGRGGSADRLDLERMRAPSPRRVRRLGPILGWTLSLGLHIGLGAWLLPALLQDPPPPPAPSNPIYISFLPPTPLVEEPAPAAEPEPVPEPRPEPEPIPEPVPESEPLPEPIVESRPVEPGRDDGSTDGDESLASEVAVLGPGPGAERTGRSKLGSRYGGRARALRAYGGGAETEEVVSRGLEWLARHQDADGSWAPHGFSRHCASGVSCNGPGLPEYRTGVTALALLAFLGAGLDHRTESPYRQCVAGALAWLTAQQDERGIFGSRDGQYFYNHGIATLAICEAAILTSDAQLLQAASRAVRAIERGQQRGGGWDYTSARTDRNDLSVTGWQVMALNAAVGAGVPVEASTWASLEEYLGRAVRRDGSAVYADRGTAAGRGGVSIAAVGLLSRLYAGWSPRSRESERAAARLVREGPDPDARADWDRTYQSTYYWYYATLALFHVGGDPWEAWNLYLQRSVIPLQHRHGEGDGSFDPDPNWLGAAGGRVMSTALGVLIFEVYYRYTPLYRKLGLPGRAERSAIDGSPTPSSGPIGSPRF
ncbi:MAG: prenyltransferase/squalene oxidase repeat-containing protein [Planctomycetota bacterium]